MLCSIRIAFFFTITLCFTKLQSQNNITVFKYNQIQGLDSSLTTKTTYELRFNQTESAVLRVSDYNPIRLISKSMKHVTTTPLMKTLIYKNRDTEKITFSELAFVTTVIVDDSLRKIDWIIKKETKTIGTYTCQKAEADYYGRHYIAWFTPEIPVSDGPWKLYGLPGLILYAEDSKKEVIFEFLEIRNSSATISPIIPKERQKIVHSMKQVVDLQHEEIKKYEDMTNSNPDNPNVTIRVGKIKRIEVFSKK